MSSPNTTPLPAKDAQGMISLNLSKERAIIAQAIFDQNSDNEMSLDELASLVDAAGAEVVASVTQKRAKPDAATLFGKGKVEELVNVRKATEADLLVVDCDLSPAQARNLESALKMRVIDRTELILDIFARRAQTKQAKLQVELAQLRYQLPRLKRMWTHLDTQSGGSIGLRGPGETQLETDKRLANTRIELLQKQLRTIRQRKDIESKARSEFETAALVGYTNVGKSALLNALSRPTGDKVLEKDMLFATLGSNTRKVDLGGGREVLLSDTVGLVRRLPHHLVESFHSTLAEVQDADILLLVADASDPELDEKLKAVTDVLGELNVLKKPRLLVFNKCDQLEPTVLAGMQKQFRDAVFTSAHTGFGLDELREKVLLLLDENDQEIELRLDAANPQLGKVRSQISKHGRILEERWDEDQLNLRVRISPRWRKLLDANAVQ
jgi:GTP-binding protein HflX